MNSKEYAETVNGVRADVRVASWSRIGTMATDALTAQDALVAAKLDWTVTKQPLTAVVPNADGVTTIEIPDKFAMVRDHKELGLGVVGVVGSRYKTIQNSEAFDFCTNLVDDGDALFEAAGSLGGGKKVFMAMRLPREIKIGGQDLVNQYLLVTNTHDGTEPLIATITSVRFACTNQIAGITRDAHSQFRFRHSASTMGRLQDAREALALSWEYTNEFEQLANRLLDTPMSDYEFKKFIDAQFPIKVNADEPSKKAVTVNDNMKSELVELWKSETQASIANTRWAAYNAVVEYADWFSPVKGKNPELRRAERTMINANNTMKNKTLQSLLVG